MRHAEPIITGKLGQSDLSQLTIRHLVKDDLIELEWGGEYTHFRRLYAQAYERAQDNKSILWVAELEGSGLIGQIFVSLITRGTGSTKRISRAYIYSFRVRQTYRNLGIGTRLLNVVETDLAERQVGITALNVAQENQAARRLYERHGYRVVGAEAGIWQYVDHKGVLRSVREPAWRMEKTLNS